MKYFHCMGFIKAKLAILLALGAIVCSSMTVAAGEAVGGGEGWVYQTLDMDVTYLPETKGLTVEGVATLRLEGENSFGPTLALNLNATLNLRADIMKYTSLSAGKGADVTINVSPNDDSHKNANRTRLATIRYQEAFQRGDTITVRFSLESIDEAFQFKVGERLVVASYEAGWYPYPVSGPNSAESHQRRALGRLTFHLPEGLHAFSNGRLVSESEKNGIVSETWEVSRPLARSFAIGPYQIERFDVNGSEVAVYLLPDEIRPVWTRGKVIPATEILDGLTNAVRILEEAYGTFPYESFGVVEVSNDQVNWWGALEEGFMMGTSGSMSTGKISLLGNISHEVAHAWWGGNIEPVGPGAYLGGESMANFSTRYFFEQYIGAELANHLFRYGSFGGPAEFNYSAKGYFQQLRDGKDAALSGLVSGSSENYNLASTKGGLMYDMLRRRIGDDEIFFGVFQGLVKDLGGKSMTLDDIRAAFVAAVPAEAKLDRFFAQWLDGAGAPKLEVSWADAGEGQVELTIEQVQTDTMFNLFLDADIYFDGVPVRKRFEIDGPMTKITIEKTGRVDDVVLDPDHVLLVWAPDYGPYPEGE